MEAALGAGAGLSAGLLAGNAAVQTALTEQDQNTQANVALAIKAAATDQEMALRNYEIEKHEREVTRRKQLIPTAQWEKSAHLMPESFKMARDFFTKNKLIHNIAGENYITMGAAEDFGHYLKTDEVIQAAWTNSNIHDINTRLMGLSEEYYKRMDAVTKAMEKAKLLNKEHTISESDQEFFRIYNTLQQQKQILVQQQIEDKPELAAKRLEGQLTRQNARIVAEIRAQKGDPKPVSGFATKSGQPIFYSVEDGFYTQEGQDKIPLTKGEYHPTGVAAQTAAGAERRETAKNEPQTYVVPNAATINGGYYQAGSKIKLVPGEQHTNDLLNEGKIVPMPATKDQIKAIRKGLKPGNTKPNPTGTPEGAAKNVNGTLNPQ